MQVCPSKLGHPVAMLLAARKLWPSSCIAALPLANHSPHWNKMVKWNTVALCIVFPPQVSTWRVRAPVTEAFLSGKVFLSKVLCPGFRPWPLTCGYFLTCGGIVLLSKRNHEELAPRMHWGTRLKHPLLLLISKVVNHVTNSLWFGW